jgi:hypothetical protein
MAMLAGKAPYIHLDPTEKQAAQADLYNAFLNHVVDVPIPSDTQFRYDPKEFVLRTNLDVVSNDTRFGTSQDWIDVTFTIEYRPELIYMDSALDNKTTFMASTVSTAAISNNLGYVYALFPVSGFNIHMAGLTLEQRMRVFAIPMDAVDGACLELFHMASTVHGSKAQGAWYTCPLEWICGHKLTTDVQGDGPYSNIRVGQAAWVIAALLCKASEVYNKEIMWSPYMPLGTIRGELIDLTGFAQDAARVTQDILENTQTYAFANLVYEGVKSYAAKETPQAIVAAADAAKEVVQTLTTDNVVAT